MLTEDVKKIWEQNAEVYDERTKKQLSNEIGTKEGWADLVMSFAPQEGSLDILDCGTGPGFFPVALGERGHRVTGIDLSENMISAAKENVAAAGVKAELLVMDCQETVFEDESFDMVISRSLTWTLMDPPKAYREWKRLLKPGGRLVITDGNFYLHNHEETQMKRFQELNDRMIRERGVGIYKYNGGKDCFREIGKDLFMSSRRRPLWDLGCLMDLGFSNVFAIPDIRDHIPGAWPEDELDRAVSDLMPMFLVGAQK